MRDTTKYYFLKVPTNFFLSDAALNGFLLKKPRLLTIFIYIGINTTMELNSNISFGDIFDFYRYKKSKDKPKSYFEILDVLKFYEKNHFFEIINQINLNSNPGYNDLIKMKINFNKFSPQRGFIKLRFYEIYALMEVSEYNDLSLDLVILTYCFIKYVVGTTKQKTFFYNAQNVAEKFMINENIVKKIISLFTKSTKTYEPLLIANKNNTKNFCEYTLNETFKNINDVSYF